MSMDFDEQHFGRDPKPVTWRYAHQPGLTFVSPPPSDLPPGYRVVVEDDGSYTIHTAVESFYPLALPQILYTPPSLNDINESENNMATTEQRKTKLKQQMTALQQQLADVQQSLKDLDFPESPGPGRYSIEVTFGVYSSKRYEFLVLILRDGRIFTTGTEEESSKFGDWYEFTDWLKTNTTWHSSLKYLNVQPPSGARPAAMNTNAIHNR